MEGVPEWDAFPNSMDECSPRPDRYSDADAGNSSPAFSNFSSCEGSDFDRYCSANSVLGSASICSSTGIYSGTGEEFSSEGYNSRGDFQTSHSNGYECLSDGGVENLRSIDYYEKPLDRLSTRSRLIYGSTEGSSSCFGTCAEDGTDNLGVQCFLNGHKLSALSSINRSFQGANGDEDSEEHEEKSALKEKLLVRQNGIQLDFDFNSKSKVEANENAFSQSNIIESDDSLLYHGIDKEGRVQFHERTFKHVEKAKEKDMNTLLLNSSVAFGSNDWDEFVHDAEEVGLDSLSLHPDQFLVHQDTHTGRKIEKEVDDLVAACSDTKNLIVMEMGNSNHVPAFNYETQVIHGQTQINDGSIYNTLDVHSVDAGDLKLKEGEVDSPPVLPINLSEGIEVNFYSNSIYNTAESKAQTSHSKGDATKSIHDSPGSKLKGQSEVQVESIVSSSVPLQPYNILNGTGGKIKRHDLGKHSSELLLINNGEVSRRVQGNDPRYNHLAEVKNQESEVKKLDAFDSYDEMVLEMEEILLNSGNCHGSVYLQANQGNMSRQLSHFDDAASNASTSTMNDIYASTQVLSKIDRVEVIGAKQKKGDVSFGERLVGVREYTIYQMKVCSGADEWKVERRYRDFFSLYCQLKIIFATHGRCLPPAWSNIDLESRKFFGNASPNVMMERSVLIEDCLHSLLNSSFSFGTPRPLLMFLTPGKVMLKSGLFQSFVPQYLRATEDENSNNDKACESNASVFGITISLVVEMKSHKSLRQMLEMQHYKCAGCHRHLDAGNTLFQELVQTFGWNRPRFCEYTGQLFCSSCHTNDTSVLPARVLHQWDFTLYPVSQLANAYLESIYDQPMLCVSAVNPFLFSKVPALLHVMGFRKKIGAMLPYIHCSFKSSIQKSLNFRRHLLEGNDFFALRDLVDLSKGPFAALPIMVENISSLILEHITQQCLICYDSGVPCAARQACHDPSSLIFPFQEAEAKKCTSCASIFHKTCYVAFLGCPCCNQTAISKRLDSLEPGLMIEPAEFLGSTLKTHASHSSTGFFTNILSKIKSDKIWKPKSSSPVILMGSLSNTS